MSRIEQAITILRATRDGNDLDPRHLYLVQLAVNDDLSPKGEAEFADLARDVEAGYVKPWFCGIENLTRDHDGYVRWRGVIVEHYSYRDSAREREAALRLGAACLAIEARGEPVTCFGDVSEELSRMRAA